jgi:hypothetical protein
MCYISYSFNYDMMITKLRNHPLCFINIRISREPSPRNLSAGYSLSSDKRNGTEPVQSLLSLNVYCSSKFIIVVVSVIVISLI